MSRTRFDPESGDLPIFQDLKFLHAFFKKKSLCVYMCVCVCVCVERGRGRKEEEEIPVLFCNLQTEKPVCVCVCRERGRGREEEEAVPV